MTDNQLSTSDIARTMQYHWQDQTRSVRRSWCTYVYRLRTRTSCDALFLAVKWGVSEHFIIEWISAGRAIQLNYPKSWREINKNLEESSWEYLGENWDQHHVRCQCRITKRATLEHFDF